MIEVIIQSAGDCEEAVLAYLDENNIQAAVKSGFAGGRENIVLYLDESEWEAFKPLLVEKLREISNIFGVSPLILGENLLTQEAWENKWKRFARTYHFGGEIIIKPSWRKLRKVPPCPVVCIDPQMAFGTGGHPSTRLCIYHLIHLRNEKPACLNEVLDVGTGSGILAITAARLGARRVMAVDIDSDAVQVAKENALRNGVSNIVEFREGTPEDVSGEYGLIMANINEAVLSGLLEEFIRHLRRSGRLVVSGILSEQGKAFVEKAARFGLGKMSQRHSRGWVSYCLGMIA